MTRATGRLSDSAIGGVLREMDDACDQLLIRTYCRKRCDKAFTELVNRHIDLVHSAALRVVRDSALAEDVTQQTFIALTKHAPCLRNRASISGWLHKTASNLAKNVVRAEERRRQRERTAAAMNGSENETDALWDAAAGHIDEALTQLDEGARDVLLWRYFERQSAAVIGDRLGISSEAAQKRVSRAVDKLRGYLAKKGVLAAATTLPATLSAHAVQVAPAGLAASTISSATAAGAFLPVPILSAFIMTSGKVKIVLSSLIAAGVVLPLTLQHREISRLKTELNAVRQVSVDHANGSEEGNPLVIKDGKDTSAEFAPASANSQTGSIPFGTPLTARGWSERLANALIKDLTDPEWKVRRGAAATLRGSNVPAEKAVPPLAEALNDEEWHVRKAAAEALTYYGDEAGSAVSSLTNALSDEEWHVRMPAAEALAAMGDAAQDATPHLVNALADEEWQVRNAAAMALASISPPNAEAVPALVTALGDEEWHVAANASMALSAIGPGAEAAVPSLIGALDHEESNVRLTATYALGMIGVPDAEVSQHLQGLANDEDNRVREAAKAALEMIEANPLD